ncbi:MAG TPA: hypothetical protein VIG24_04030 [Acidimicrobiia bacterium]
MISLTLRVVAADSETDYRLTPAVVVAFERQFKVGIGKAFASEQKAEHMYWLAWKCVQHSGAEVKPFEGWLDTITDVQMVEDTPRP